MKSTRSRLRIGVAAFAGILIMFLLFAFKSVNVVTDDLWARLGMKKEQGLDGVKRSFIQGYLCYYGAYNIKSIATGDRAAVASELLTTAKQYLNSEAFKKEYELHREKAKPQEPVTAMPTKEQVRKQEIAKMEELIKQTEELKKKSPEFAKDLQEAIDSYKTNIKDFKDPDNAMIELYYAGEKSTYESSIAAYKKDLAKWNQTYPEDFRQLIKNRLKKFLELSATVDFNAELKEVYHKQKFVNPAYEAKPAEWKQIFRAGKEVTEVTRKFAQQWLAE
jgi:hypothetical protein